MLTKNFLSWAGARPSLEDPWLYERVNVRGTLNLLEASGVTGVKKFVFGSSSSVYGLNSKVSFKENDSLLNSISPYAATKIAEKPFAAPIHISIVSLLYLLDFLRFMVPGSGRIWPLEHLQN